MEYARNALGIRDAQHEETAPKAQTLVITRLSCSLAGKRQTIHIKPGSIAHKAYAREEIREEFVCSYGLNPQFSPLIRDGRLKASGMDDNNEIRVMELPYHPFFVATLYQPQISSTRRNPHPLILAFLNAAHECGQA